MEPKEKTWRLAIVDDDTSWDAEDQLYIITAVCRDRGLACVEEHVPGERTCVWLLPPVTNDQVDDLIIDATRRQCRVSASCETMPGALVPSTLQHQQWPHCEICTMRCYTDTNGTNVKRCGPCQTQCAQWRTTLEQRYATQEQRDALTGKHIVNKPEIRSGEHCIAGTRLTVIDAVSIVLHNELEDYDYVTQEQWDAVMVYYLFSL